MVHRADLEPDRADHARRGDVTEFSAASAPRREPGGIAAGPDGNLWFTKEAGDRIGRITPARVITEFSAGITPGARPFGIGGT